MKRYIAGCESIFQEEGAQSHTASKHLPGNSNLRRRIFSPEKFI